MNRIVVWAEVSMLGRDELQRHLAENVLVDGILGDRLVKQSQMCCNLVWTLSFRGKPDTAADIAEVGAPGPRPANTLAVASRIALRLSSLLGRAIAISL